MMYKPKSTRDIYIDSFSVNSTSLERQLLQHSVARDEIMSLLDSVSKLYRDNVDKIVEECERDMMYLERVPSPLKLFVDCLSKVERSMSLSPQARAIMQQYALAWEDWM